MTSTPSGPESGVPVKNSVKALRSGAPFDVCKAIAWQEYRRNNALPLDWLGSEARAVIRDLGLDTPVLEEEEADE